MAKGSTSASKLFPQYVVVCRRTWCHEVSHSQLAYNTPSFSDMACALVSPCGHVELFQNVGNLNVNDVLQVTGVLASTHITTTRLQQQWYSPDSRISCLPHTGTDPLACSTRFQAVLQLCSILQFRGEGNNAVSKWWYLYWPLQCPHAGRPHLTTLGPDIHRIRGLQVNEFASGFAQQLIKGDACLVHDKQQHLLDCLLQSKQLRIAQAAAPSNSSSSSHEVLVSTFDDDVPVSTAVASDVVQPGCCEADTPLVLQQPPRLSRITAANNTRQRILRSMSATGVSSTLPAAVPAAHTPISGPAASRAHQSSSSSSGCSETTLYSSSCDSPGTNSSSSCRIGSIGRMPRSAEGVGAVHSSKPHSTLRFDYSSHSSNSISSGSRSSSSSTHVEQEMPHQYTQQQFRESFHQRLAVGAADDAVPMDMDATQQPHAQQAHLQLQYAPQRVTDPHSHAHAQPVAGTAAAAAPAVPPGPSLAAAAAVSGACVSVCPYVWGDIPVEVMAQVASFMGSTVAAVMPICMTCR